MDLTSFKEAFDVVFGEYLNKCIQKNKDIIQHDTIARIWDHLFAIATAGGKRIRPYCVYVWYKLYGGKDDMTIMQFAVLTELLHTMALVHDDIMDEANKRHNIATIHSYLQAQDKRITRRVAEGQAILVWDLLLAWVYELLHQEYSTFDTIQLMQAQQTIHTMIQEVILWQMLDVDLSIGDSADLATLERKNLYKTARYSFARPLLAGAQLAGSDNVQQSLMMQLGEELGIAYQIRDDLLDILESETDKTTFADVQEGQQTYLTYYINASGTPTQKTLLHKHMWQKLNTQHIIELKQMFFESWAIDFAKAKMTEHIAHAHSLLNQLTIVDDTMLSPLHALLSKFENFN